jgi:hypothetical protein
MADARAQELEPWLDLVAVRGEVIVQFWLRPGQAAVTLGPGGSKRWRGFRSSSRGFCEGAKDIRHHAREVGNS